MRSRMWKDIEVNKAERVGVDYIPRHYSYQWAPCGRLVDVWICIFITAAKSANGHLTVGLRVGRFTKAQMRKVFHTMHESAKKLLLKRNSGRYREPQTGLRNRKLNFARYALYVQYQNTSSQV